ncbi:hypothetical protein HC823_01555 [Candidatus Gracilibacteria bacterium]|nr:hypothetical protein [Candidatus Gracilibacteria bacterium]
MAAIQMMKGYLPKSKIRFVNVSELTALGVGDETVGSSDELLDKHFTKDKGVIYNFHGYPQTIKKLLFDYSGSNRIKVNGYLEEGSTTSPFDMQTRNRTSRYHLVVDMAQCFLDQKVITAAEFKKIEKDIEKRLKTHRDYIIKHGDDPKELAEWQWCLLK